MQIIEKFDLSNKTIDLLKILAITGLEFKQSEKLCKNIHGAYCDDNYTYTNLTLCGIISEDLAIEVLSDNSTNITDSTQEFINWYNIQIIAYRYLNRRSKDKPLPMNNGKTYILKPPTQGISTYGINPAMRILKAAQYEYNNKPTNGVIYR